MRTTAYWHFLPQRSGISLAVVIIKFKQADETIICVAKIQTLYPQFNF